MPSRRLSLMLFMAVAIGSGLLICRTIYEKTFQHTMNDEQYSKLPLGPVSADETILKKKLESLERSTENRAPSYRSQIQMQSDSLKSDVGFSNSGPRVEPSRKRFRRHSRKKRSVVKDSNGWFFNLNVTRPGETVSLSNEEKANPRFGISIHVEGETDSDDVQVAWDHVQTLVQNLFGGSYEELSKRGHEVIIDLSGLPNNARTDLKAKEHLVEIQPPKGKEAKFFLGLLGMGGNRVKPTTEKVISEVSSSFAPSAITSIAIPITEGIPSPTEIPLLEVHPVFTDPTISRPITTESTVKPLVEHLEKFPVENSSSITLESSNFSNGLTVVPHVEYVETVPIKSMDSKGESSTSVTEKDESGELLKLRWTSTVAAETPKVTQSGVPLENVNFEEISTESSVLKLSSGTIDLEENVDESLVTAVPTESFFSVGVSVSPEQLREFCVSILEKVQKSPWSVRELNFEGSENATADNKGVVQKTTETNITTEAPNRPKPENSGFFASILNRIVGRNAAKKTDATSASKRPKSDDQKSNFFNKLVWNSGRGRSLEEELENLHLEDDINGAEFEDHNVTVSDCERFFQDWLNMDQDVPTPDPLKATTLKVEDAMSLEVITEPNEIENQTTHSFDKNAKSPILENAGRNSSSVITERSISEMITFKAEDEDLDIIERSDRGTTADSVENDARIFGIFEELAIGSGAREISVDINDELAENISTSINGHDLVIKEKNLATEDISKDVLEVTTKKGRPFIGFLNLGSGERQLGEESEFTDDYLFTGVSKTGISTHSETGTKDTNGNFHKEDFSNSITTDASMLSQGFDQMPSTEMAKEYPTTEDDLLHRRFINFLNIGSGDGRELSETNDSGLGIFLPECLSCSVDNRTGEVKCSECTQDEIALRKSEVSTITINVSTEKGQLENHQGGSEESDPNERFFLSGNRDSTEEIVMKDHDDLNTTTLLPLLAHRGSRALDDPIAAWDNNESEMFDPIVENEFVVTREPRPVHKDPSSSKGRRGRSEDSPLEDPNDPFVAKFVTSPDFVVGVDRISVEIVRNVRPSSKPELPKFTFNESFVEYFVTKPTATAGEDVITTTGGQRLPRSNRCNDDDDCYSDLNEMCVAQERQFVCGCEDGFVRSPISRICSNRVVLEMTIKLHDEYYHPDLNDTSSDTFEKTKKDFIQSVKILLKDLQILQDSLVDIEIKRFEPGSLIVHANLVFAKPKEMTSFNIVVSVMEIFKNGVHDPKFLEVAPLNMENTQILKIFVAGDVCDHQGNFKCHKNAKCIPEKNGAFTCECKRGYVDLNLNGAPGRDCEACPDEFCNGNGICKISHVGMKYCQCEGWNVGPRCAIPGTVVIGGVAAFNALFLVIIVVVICLFRRRKSHSSGQYNGGEEGFAGTPSSAVPSRLRETVAMNELGQSVVASKYASRSTPFRHKCPDINIISPSNVGSDQSSVFDSTFDRSTCEQEDAEEKV